jgi:hypothetical protein
MQNDNVITLSKLQKAENNVNASQQLMFKETNQRSDKVEAA